MSDKEQAVHCPYCGTEMEMHCDLRGYWYVCSNAECKGFSPYRKTQEEAYKAAMRRCEEPNRVLTLKEACEAEVCWTETPQTSLPEACRIVMREYTSFPEGKPAKSFDFYETGETVPWCCHPEEYGVLVRCWLRKPTTEEMANTPWGAKHNEH